MKHKQEPGQPDDIHHKAQERLSEIGSKDRECVSEADALALLHELQVHQIELELQNDELQRANITTDEALRRYTDLYDFAPVGYFTFDGTSRILEANLAGADLLGVDRASLLGASFLPSIALESREVLQGTLLRALETKTKQSAELTLLRNGGTRFFVLVEAVAVETADEHPVQWRATVTDISRRKEAEDILRRAHGELQMAKEALDVEIVERKRVEFELRKAREESERVAAELQAFITSIADGAALFDAEGEMVFMNDAGMQILDAPEGESFAGWLDEYERYTLEGERLPSEEDATCRALRGETVKDQRLRMVTPWGKDVILSNSASPVRDAGGGIVGASVVFHDTRDRVEFERQRQALYEREHNIAGILQEALIPSQREFSVGGCRIAVKYEPALREAEVGGDFYDVFELSEGKIGIVIGDVAGKGLAAAIRVASVRYALRSYAYLGADAAQVMTLTNEALCKERDDASGMLTAILAVVDVPRRLMMYACAGHEPPFARGPEGDVKQLNNVGRALGVEGGFEYSQSSRVLGPGEMVVMFTDGINEAMRENRKLFDEEGVIRFLSGCRGCTPSEMALGLLDAAKQHAGGEFQDDVAIVVFELEDGAAEGDRE